MKQHVTLRFLVRGPLPFDHTVSSHSGLSALEPQACQRITLKVFAVYQAGEKVLHLQPTSYTSIRDTHKHPGIVGGTTEHVPA